jgi:hypothetical protein
MRNMKNPHDEVDKIMARLLKQYNKNPFRKTQVDARRKELNAFYKDAIKRGVYKKEAPKF